MIRGPKSDQTVYLWYAKKKRPWTPYHGLEAVVVCPGKHGRNHLVEAQGKLITVPSGNLITPTERYERVMKERHRKRCF